MAAENDKLLLTTEGAPKDRIVGFETEYALGCTRVGHTRPDYIAAEVLAHTHRSLQSSEFGEDGDREYLDVGNHPELSPAEELDFMNATYRLLSGHLKMARRYKQSAEYVTAHPDINLKIGAVSLVANTCSPEGSSWASHENLLALRSLEPRDYIAALAIHHLSRIVWSGAGNIAPRQGGFRFTLSEKAGHIWEIANNNDTRARPLVHLRDEPLADPEKYRRIHTTCGESIFSPLGNALRLATDSIILRACELGINFDDLMPRNPVMAMRMISSDPSLKLLVPLADGREFTGLDLQNAVLERALKAAEKAHYLTQQESEYVKPWQDLLDDLGIDPSSCAKRVDWVVKKTSIDKEPSSRRGADQSDEAVAWAKAIDYHQILPTPGLGLRLLQKGFFERSPSREILENGLPLPPTRALPRGNAIGKLNRAGEEFEADWYKITSMGKYRKNRLPDPYSTEEVDLGPDYSEVA